MELVDVKYFKLAVGNDRIHKETNVDISARCPVCGDSERRNKGRLHLYTKGNVTNINCFNGGCPVHNKTVYSFLRDFFPALLNQYKKETFRTRMGNIQTDNSNMDYDVFKNITANASDEKDSQKIHINEDIEYLDLTSYFIELSESKEGLDYLESRGISYDLVRNNFGNFYFSKTDLEINDKLYGTNNSIIIPLYANGKMYGFYSRSTVSKSFYTFVGNNIGLKAWNFFSVNNNEPVYIFEGIFDGIASGFTNIVGSLGAKIPSDLIKKIKEPVFVLDNDKTGLGNAIEYAKNGYSVYVQPNKYNEKDINELHLNNPELDIKNMIKKNLYSGISAEVRIKEKL